jgi:hypothetical protein
MSTSAECFTGDGLCGRSTAASLLKIQKHSLCKAVLRYVSKTCRDKNVTVKILAGRQNER